MNTLLERLQTVEKRYEELTQILMDPSIANDIQKMTQASKEQASLEKAYNLYKEYKALLDGIEEAKELLNENDPEIKEMAKMELEELEKKQPIMEHDIQIELIPKDPNDEKNVVKEISSQVTYLECILSMLNHRDGRLKLKMLSLQKQEDIHLYHLLSRVLVYILR